MYMQSLTTRKREPISQDLTTTLLGIQEGRCSHCGDILKKFEKHHKKPVAAGGTDDIDNLELLPLSRDRDRKARAGRRHAQCVFRVQIRTTYAHCICRATPSKSHPLGANKAMHPRDTSVKCLDIVCCRSNFFMERTRDIPVGCPLDEMEPVFVNGCYDLTRFEWFSWTRWNNGETQHSKMNRLCIGYTMGRIYIHCRPYNS